MRILRKLIRYMLLEGVQDDITRFISDMKAANLEPEKKLEYIKKRLGFLGRGSSRAAFVLGDRVLKVAMNNLGVEQNKVEAKMSNHVRLGPYMAKIFEADPEHYWILMERVITDEDYVAQAWNNTFGGDIADFYNLLMFFESNVEAGMNFKRALEQARLSDFYYGARFTSNVYDLLVRLYELGIRDLHSENIGATRDGRPVLLDVGVDAGVQDMFFAGGMLKPFKGAVSLYRGAPDVISPGENIPIN